MAPDARHGPIKPPEVTSTLKEPACLVTFLLRCCPEPELGVARLCRSANDPAKSPPLPPPPPHGGLSPDGVRKKLRQGQQAGMGGQAELPPYAVGPFAYGPF